MDRDTADEIKRHFNVVAESLRSEVRAVADAVSATNERLDRFEAKVAEDLGEVKAMIRLSFGQLDQRIRTLEEDMASLRARLDRLEARTPPS
jgi:ubiquinone biosynthesis protein UbiJ